MKTVRCLFVVLFILGFYTDGQSQIFPEPKSSNAEAVKLYEKGAELAAEAGVDELDVQQWEKGIASLKKALELDPSFAAAHFVLALAYHEGYLRHPEKTRDERNAFLDMAREEYRKAAEVDPTNPEFLFEVAERTKDLENRISLYKKVLELDPNYKVRPIDKAHVADSDGKVEEAFEQLIQELRYESPGEERCIAVEGAILETDPEFLQYGYSYFAKKYPERYAVFVERVCKGENLPGYERAGGE